MRNRSLATRWLGVGLASCLAVTTVGLWFTGRLALYVNPDSAWFVVGMAVVLLIGAVASFALPLGAEEDHGHDGHDHDHDQAHDETHTSEPDTGGALPRAGVSIGAVATVTGGVLASGVVVTMLVTPPASLSAELAMSRDAGAPPLFAGADIVTLASSGDTSEFGIGDWASVFATATSSDTFDGEPVTLTGFVTPGEDGAFDLTRLVITHCVIDAQPASIPIALRQAQGSGGQAQGSGGEAQGSGGPAERAEAPDTGQWVTVTGTVRATSAGALEVQADEVRAIDEPADPYEY